VCCTALPIETKELRKPPGISCEHCTQSGCAIYETRFPICRSYYCGWRNLPDLDEDWRPDKSGVLISPQNENIPAKFSLREGIEFLVIGGEAAIRRKGFAEVLARCVAGGIPTFLAIPGPPDHYAARALVNDILAAAVEKREIAAVTELLVGGFKASMRHEFRKMI
jgi:hypothetical protein